MAGGTRRFGGEQGHFQVGDLADLVTPRLHVKPRIFYDLALGLQGPSDQVEPGICIIRGRAIRAAGMMTGPWVDVHLVVTPCGRVGWASGDCLRPLEASTRDPHWKEPDRSKWPQVITY